MSKGSGFAGSRDQAMRAPGHYCDLQGCIALGIFHTSTNQLSVKKMTSCTHGGVWV